jgi:hypothetical protein
MAGYDGGDSAGRIPMSRIILTTARSVFSFQLRLSRSPGTGRAGAASSIIRTIAVFTTNRRRAAEASALSFPPLSSSPPRRGGCRTRRPGALARRSFVVCCCGWPGDDIRSLSAAVRLVFQLLVAAVFVHARAGWMTSSCRALGAWTWAPCDPCDGAVHRVADQCLQLHGRDRWIAGLQAVAAGVGWVGAGHYLGDSLLAGAGAVVAGASLGFLLFNWSPASIFMGDVGRRFSDSLRRPDRIRLHSVSVGRLCRPPLSCGPSSLTRSSR